MTQTRIAYMPLATYPEAIPDESILAATTFAAAIDCALQVTTFAVEVPRPASPIGNLLIDVPSLIRGTEDRSRAECERLQGLVKGAAGSGAGLHCASRKLGLGAVLDAAVAEARYFDLSVLPWSGQTVAAGEMAQAIVFGSGRPTLLVPPTARSARLDHIAIAWDASRFAARALGDALPLLAEGGRVSVLTVQDEKPLGGPDPAGALAASLERRGFRAAPLAINIGGRTIAEALQDTAVAEGAQILAMGGFGHSRFRDFILGGATKGVLADLRLPALISH
jgi:nucleotide-binding universal stress UspA family protein